MSTPAIDRLGLPYDQWQATLQTLHRICAGFPAVRVREYAYPEVDCDLFDPDFRRRTIAGVKRALEDAGVDLATRGAPGREYFQVFGLATESERAEWT